MSTPRRPVLLALAVVLALGACTGGGGQEPSFTHDLVDLGPVEAQQVTLDDGSELVVGSDGDHAFVAQWREPGGDGWSEPQTLVEGSDLDAGQLSLDAAGDTAVVGTAWYAADDDERETHARLDAAVCRDYRCDVVAEGVGGVPTLALDGDLAVVDTEDEADGGGDDGSHDLLAWEGGSQQWEPETVSGPPPLPSGVDYLTAPVVVLDDGSYATVHGTDTDDGCRVELWSGGPRATTLDVVASTDARTLTDCTPENVETDGEVVSFYLRAIDQTVTFTPTGDGGWEDDLPASTPDGGSGSGGFPTVLTALEDGGSVAVGSPDGRRVTAQYRGRGDQEWTRPVTVARSSAGQRCRMARSATVLDRTDVMYVVTCWPRGSWWGDEHDDAPPPSSGFALASAEGRDWVVEPLDDPAYEPNAQVSEPALLARGSDRSLVWRPGATAFEEVALPLEHPTVDALLVTGDSAVRVTGNPDPNRPCRPTWSTAPPTASSWQDSGAIRPVQSYARGDAECYGVVYDQEELGRVDRSGREFRVAGVIGSTNSSIDGNLVRTRDGWRFEPGA